MAGCAGSGKLWNGVHALRINGIVFVCIKYMADLLAYKLIIKLSDHSFVTAALNTSSKL